MVTEGVTSKGVFYLAQLSGDKGIQAPEITGINMRFLNTSLSLAKNLLAVFGV